MFSYILSFFNFFGKKSDCESEDNNKEDFLADQLVELEIANEQAVNDRDTVDSGPEIPRNACCFQKTGKVSYLGDDYILIDGMLYFNINTCPLTLNVNDKIVYLCYEDANESVIVVRILENHGNFWGNDEELFEEKSYQVMEHVMIGEVDCREERYVIIKDSDLKFNLDDVEGTFVPISGDWLQMRCTVQYDDNKPTDVKTSQVLQVMSFKPLRKVIKSATVTEWFGDSGSCNSNIFFDNNSLETGAVIEVGRKVMVEAIESNQGAYTWRALNLVAVAHSDQNIEETAEQPDEEKLSLEIEKEKYIFFTHPIKFDNVNLNGSQIINAPLTNNSDKIYIINRWSILSRKRDSQIEIRPEITKPVRLYPGKSFLLTIRCTPKFLGYSKECFVISCKGFQIKRFIAIKVSNHNNMPNVDRSHISIRTENERMEMMRHIRQSYNNVVPGVRPTRPPNFIPVRLGIFPIPRRLWSIMLEEFEEIGHYNYDRKLEYVLSNIPILNDDLSIKNYKEKWHTLLFLEEIQLSINMRIYDKSQSFMIRCQEFLGVEICGLSERRPSLIKGDRVIVQDAWDKSSTKYEGYIHAIKGDLILMKFNPQFQDSYTGTDVSLEFHFNRSIFRRAHQAVDLVFTNIGVDVLFPRKMFLRSQQVPPKMLDTISWFNKNLNNGQKAAVINIVKGESRPLPYCIFGPPGTGKTVTVVETILQILTFLPDSRILVATPSNSAANLVTERLLQHRKTFSDSMIRLIANYLVDSDNIPDMIKPFCATMDIAREDTAESRHAVINGINMNCQTSFIGRHRVTIGTCYCIGTLAQMGLPRGHFTHVIVDEAGQATEPEIMIPLTFIDKDNSQVVLAGDPKQLGPVIMSKYCNGFGLEESYMERLLQTYPYKKDFHAFENGYNKKLLTKLNDNYRSLKEVLCVSSDMFYDGSLVPMMKRDQPWVRDILRIVAEVFDTTDTETGGIYVYGIQGSNERSNDNPSWYNPEEASMVALSACKLYKKGITADDIGIITPYIAQTRYIKTLFDAMGLPQPKIGTVEEFQGQERPVILLSTVRSSEMWLNDDKRFSLGFVQNPKRLNVAITRAQLAFILFCNPHLLCTDPLWKTVIDYAVKNDKYMGCNLPDKLVDKKYMGCNLPDKLVDKDDLQSVSGQSL